METWSKVFTFFCAFSLSLLAVISSFYSAAAYFKTYDKEELSVIFSKPSGEITMDTSQNASPHQSSTSSAAKETTVSSEVTTEKSDSTVPAATSKEAVGKIISQTYSSKSGEGYNGCYIRDNTSSGINIKDFVSSDWGQKLTLDGSPEVLIIHTHATESYMSEDRNYYTKTDATRSTDNSKNMIQMGNIICERLETAGIKTLHETTQFDYPAYTGSYSRAAKVIKEYLKKYPTIKVVLDVHRDSISSGADKTKPVATIDGKKTAQVMLVMGSNTGSVSSFPHWKKNLSLAAKFQQTMYNSYPNLTRSMLVSSKVYNQNLCTGSMLIEIGTEANSLEEAENASYLVGETLAKTLKKVS